MVASGDSLVLKSKAARGAVDAPENGQTIQYAIEDAASLSGWQAGLAFSGLKPGTYYKAVASAMLEVTTDPVYAVAVTNGTDAGSYAAGEIMELAANTTLTGYRFKEWQVVKGGVSTASRK